MNVPVSLMGNLTMAVLPPLTTHDYKPPPPLPPEPPFVPAIEAPVPVMWPPGFGMQQNKLTTTVVHKFQFIMLEGHDCGYMIPHVTIPPTNLQLPIIIAFSSRKVSFSSSKVKANGTAIGCSQLMLIPMPMMTCASPITSPCSYPVLNAINTVTVGMTVGDFLAGIVSIALSMLADALCYAFRKLGPFKNVFAKICEEELGDVAGPLVATTLGKLVGASNIAPFVIKTVLGAIAGGAKILLTGEGNIKISVGSGYFGGSVGYTRTGDQQNQYTVQGQAGAPGFTSSASAQHTSNPDGSTSNKVSETDAAPVVQSSHSSKTDYDSSGHETKTTETDSTTGGAPLPGGSAIDGTSQTQTVTKPGQPPTSSSTDYGGADTPFGGKQLWGDPL
jgi:hypothetical protein